MSSQTTATAAPTEHRILRRAEVEAKTGFKRAHIYSLMKEGKLDPLPLVTHHMKLADAPEAYAVYDRREALKIVMAP